MSQTAPLPEPGNDNDVSSETPRQGSGLDAARQLSDYFDLCFGPDDHGYLHCPTLQRWDSQGRAVDLWEENYCAWPDNRAAAIAWILEQDAAGFDVHICPNILKGEARLEGTAVGPRNVHVDVDEGKFDPDKVARLGGFAVASGSEGNAHVYVRLSRPATTIEHAALCRGLKEYFGAKDSKIRDNDVLRPAGTHNHKVLGEVRPVRLIRGPDERMRDPQELAAQLGIALASHDRPPVMDNTQTHITTQEAMCVHQLSITEGALDPAYLRILQEGVLDRPDGNGRYRSRSEALFAVALHALNRGWDYDSFAGVVMRPKHASSRWRSSGAMRALIDTTWKKAKNQAQRRPVVRSKTDAIRIVEDLQKQIARPWPGRGGPIEREVLEAMLEIALSLGSVEFDVSLRELASASGRSLSGTRNAMGRLIKQGWIARVHSGSLSKREAARYRLNPPHQVLPSAALSQDEYVGPHDYWSSLPASARQIYQALRGKPGTIKELGERSGRHRHSIATQLRRLEP